MVFSDVESINYDVNCVGVLFEYEEIAWTLTLFGEENYMYNDRNKRSKKLRNAHAR